MSTTRPASAAWATVRNVISLSTARAISLPLQLVAFTILVAALGPEDAGVYTFALALVLLFQFATDLGLKGIAVRDVSQDDAREPRAVPNLLYVRLILGLAAYVAMAALAAAVSFAPDVRSAALLMGIVLPLIALDSFGVSLDVRLRLGIPGVAGVLQGVVSLLGAIWLAQGDAGVLAFVLLFVVASAVRITIVAAAGLRVGPTLDWRPRRTEWHPLIVAALPVALSGVFFAAYTRLDLIVIGVFKSADDVGQYGVAYRFFDALILLAGVVQAAVWPVLARSWSRDRSALPGQLQRIVDASLAVALPIAVGGAMVAWRLVPAIPGLEEFDGAGVALSILIVAYVPIFVGHLLHASLVIAHRQRALVGIALSGLLLNAALTILLVRPFSFVGAAVATAATEIVILGVGLIILQRLLGIRLGARRLGRVASATAIMAVVLAIGYLLPPLAQLGLGAIGYLGAAWALGIVSREQWAVLRAGRGGPTEGTA
ncbi:MAG: oligosaccharide flippase family protein [Miltoncostaeaceae bacterium]